MAGQPADRAMLAQRIQGFGNVNPPPLEEETGATLAKKAVGRLGDMVGEEVMLTVEDFKEKGAVGAVKDAVADAGDILIDGVSGIIGWIRGDAPPEEECEKAEDATKALAYGPNGAAYGISQASPTGGINAVWVMPEEADPSALAQLASQQGGGGLVNDPRVPKNIQPYQPPPGRGPPAGGNPNFSTQIPGGGPVIAPYQPAPAGPSIPPYIPGAGPGFPNAGFQPGFQQPGFQQPGFQQPGFQQPGRWGPGGYSGGLSPGSSTGASGSSSATGGAGAKGLVERISKGEVLVGPDVAKRLVSQCTATKTSAKQLAEMVCERSRRLYLGLDGGDPAEADAALARLLGLTDVLQQSDSSAFVKTAVEEIRKGVTEEFLSLRSSAKHKDTVLPMLQRLGLVDQKSASPEVDLLGGGGGGSGAAAAQEADLLGGTSQPAAKEADLLGNSEAPAPAASSDLLDAMASPPASSTSGAGVASLDPLLSAAPAAAGAGNLLGGLSLDAAAMAAAAPASTVSPAGASASAGAATLGAGAVLQEKKSEDIFGFVGAEMSKASSKP